MPLSEGLELRRRGLGAAVPRFRQAGNRRSEVLREFWRGAPCSLVGHRPDSREYLAAQKPRLLGARDERLNLLLQLIDTGVLVSPGVT